MPWSIEFIPNYLISAFPVIINENIAFRTRLHSSWDLFDIASNEHGMTSLCPQKLVLVHKLKRANELPHTYIFHAEKELLQSIYCTK